MYIDASGGGGCTGRTVDTFIQQSDMVVGIGTAFGDDHAEIPIVARHAMTTRVMIEMIEARFAFVKRFLHFAVWLRYTAAPL